MAKPEKRLKSMVVGRCEGWLRRYGKYDRLKFLCAACALWGKKGKVMNIYKEEINEEFF